MKGSAMCIKKYVAVTAEFDQMGNIIPLVIKWDDETIFKIDRVTNICRAASLKAGGAGIRYTCIIKGRSTYLFLEETKWFVEAKV